MKEFSKYIVTWAEITPNKGIVTKHDRKAFGDILLLGVETKHFKHFADKESAKNWIKNFNKKLDKNYTVRLFTDAQFALAKTIGGETTIPFTKKQMEEVFVLLPK